MICKFVHVLCNPVISTSMIIRCCRRRWPYASHFPSLSQHLAAIFSDLGTSFLKPIYFITASMCFFLEAVFLLPATSKFNASFKDVTFLSSQNLFKLSHSCRSQYPTFALIATTLYHSSFKFS